jgi:hypothetical protein
MGLITFGINGSPISEDLMTISAWGKCYSEKETIVPGMKFSVIRILMYVKAYLYISGMSIRK